MNEKRHSWIRPTGRWTDMILVAVLLSFLMMTAGQLFYMLIDKLVNFERTFSFLIDSESVIHLMMIYFAFIGIWVAFFLMCGIPKCNRPILKQLAPNKNGNTFKGAMLGLVCGFAVNGFCVLGASLMGDIHLFFNEFNPLILFVFLLFILIQSGAEEIMDRAYLYQKLRRRYNNPIIAIAGNAVLFAAIHLLNSGITARAVLSIIEIGIFFSLVIYYYDSLWFAIMFHAAWNFTQNIIFGLPNSGIVSEYSLFKLEAASAENGFFYDVAFGVEGSIACLLIIAIISAVILLINRGKPEKNDVWGEDLTYGEIKG